MKLKFLSILCVFSIISIFCFAQNPYKQNLLDLATIDFPAKPVSTEAAGQEVLHYADSAAHYLIVIQDLSNKRGFEINDGSLNEFYKGTIIGTLKTAGGKLISKKDFEIQGMKGLDIVYTATSNPKLPDLRFKRIILLNNRLFSIDFWTYSAKEKETQTVREKFFSSFLITADKANLTQNNKASGSNMAYNAGYTTGKLIGTFAVLGVIVVAIFLIMKMIKRKRK